jgi:DNA polymerase III subunit alpha
LEGGMVDDYIEVKHGRKPAEYKHPVMKDILEETHGVMVYQEQVMRILHRLGDIELANAYTCIKAISKKKEAMIAKYYDQFLAGAQQKGLSAEEAEEVFVLIKNFAGYGFNKSHSTAYALIAYMTAYLKAHWPTEFMAALLSSDMPGRNFTKKDALVEHLEDCKRMGVEVVFPNVQSCGPEFEVGDNKVFFGLGVVKGCGVGAAEAIVAARKAGGPFRDFFDFCERLDPGAVNRTAIESLIKAGACDGLGGLRNQLFQVIDRAMQSSVAAAADRRSGQRNMFGGDDEAKAPVAVQLPNQPEWPEREKLAKEKEVVGCYLSSHPLAEHQKTLAGCCTHTTVQAAELKHRSDAMLGGLIANINFRHTKNPRPGSPSRYAIFDLEDVEGVIRCIIWPEQFAQCGEMIQPDAILVIQGTVEKRPGSDEANLIVGELISLEDLEDRFTRGIHFRLLEDVHGVRGVEQLHEILRGYPGNAQVQLSICLSDGTRIGCDCEKLRVKIDPEMRRRAEELLGSENIRMIVSKPQPKPSATSSRSNGYSKRPAASH